MAKLKISDYSSTSAGANLNTDINSINIDEGCAASGINDALRTLMAQLKDFQTGVSGDGLTLGGALSGTSATFSGNVTASAISGASLTLSGNITASAISGASLTLSGNVTASAISGASMTLSGDLTVDTNTLYVDSTNNKVGIGTSSPGEILHLNASSAPAIRIQSTAGSMYIVNRASSTAMEIFNAANGPLWLGTNNSERMRIASNGYVGIGTSSPGYPLHINASRAYLVSSSNTELMTTCTGAGATVTGGVQALTNQSIRLGSINDFNTEIVRANVVKATATTSGFAISGALSKSSGSFKIDHPIPELTDTHHLVHSFVESPQANNIYRGKVELVNGQAIVNLDTVSSMTEGTFVLLNRDIHCYTSNETDWDAVKGSVNGNILTIQCQNENSTATISWLVIGERHDIHMYDTDWTDENGKVIVEPEKEINKFNN